MGGGSWSRTSTFFVGEDILWTTQKGAMVNSTAECKNREIIIVTEPWTNAGAGYTAQLCDTKYYMANVSVSIDLNGDEPEISFQDNEYQQKKVPISDTLVNITEFQDLVLNRDWATYMISILWSRTAMMGGASVLLGALYNYNMSTLVHDPELTVSAAKAKQRYFGEVLQASLSQQGASQKAPMQGTVHSVQARVVVQSGSAISMGILFALSFLLLLFVWWRSRLQSRPLNLEKDPATTVGVAHLLTQDLGTRYGFQSLQESTTNDLQKQLTGQRYYTDSQGLSHINQGDFSDHDPSPSENGTPGLLRLPALLGLMMCLVLVATGLAVLYHYAERSDLYGHAFVYQFKLSHLEHGMSIVAPFSMIPTIIAIGLGLWWAVIDEDFRRLQPFLSIARSNAPFKRGVDLSYQSSYWFWAAGKAALNRHWLLFFVTLGATLSPAFTTSMSALFNRGTTNITQPVTLHRSLELRDIPFIFKTVQSLYPGYSNDYTAYILAELYKNISSYWMYTATIQLALNGSEPAWSKDGWSFVPLDLDISTNKSLSSLGASRADSLGPTSQANVTFDTPAIRGRMECTPPPFESLTNFSNWLTPTYLKDHSVWNVSTIPNGLPGGYRLGSTWHNGHNPGIISPLTPSQNWTFCPGCTSVFVNPSSIICCSNKTTDARNGSVGIGYWSPNTDLTTWTPRGWQSNFTVKWFHGEAYSGIKMNSNEMTIPNPGLIFPYPPSVSMLNCKPLVETASARVTVNPANGEVQSFSITDKPKISTEAFADNFLPHNGSVVDRLQGFMHYNVSVSCGHLFTSTLLTAADTANIGGVSHSMGYAQEDLSDNTYNIRDEMNGLNMDFMTYSMYTMANKDPTALLDMETFTTLAQKTYTTFFQHFVSNNISLQTGGWAYQRINASLPRGLGPVVNLVDNYLPGTTPSKYQDILHPISHTNRTVAAQITKRVELLQMNSTAVWLSMGILGWLIGTMAVVSVLQKRYFGTLRRNIECLGDVCVLIAGSANLLQLARDIRAGRLAPGDYKHLRTRLGWFVDVDGGLRWGIEMEESYAEGPGVKWVDDLPGEKSGDGNEDGEEGGMVTGTVEDEERAC